MHVLGLDVGTTGVKSAIFTLGGEMVSLKYKEYKMNRPRPDYAEFDPKEIWESSAHVLKQSILQSKVDPRDISALGVTGIGGALVPVDKRGECLSAILAQYDRRERGIQERFRNHHADKRKREITGFGLGGVELKIRWFKENRPEIYEKTSTFLGGPEYVMLKLSGERAIDYSMGSCFGLLNPIERTWDEELIEAMGLDQDKLPGLRSSGSVVGEVGPEVSAVTGLRKGTPVAIGGYDVMCGSLGVGAISEGIVMDVTGTVEQVAATVPSDYLKKISPEHRVFFGCHVARGRYFATGGIPTAGSLFRWYRDNFGREEMKEAEEKGLDVYDILAGEASTAGIGSGKLLVLPNFFGEGAMIGFDLSHGRKEVIRAILEGITFGMKKYIEESFESTGINVSELRAIGGGAKSDLWLQIKANVINRRIIVPSVTESTSLGAAMMAGIGVGIYKDEDDAVEKTFKKRKMFTPEPAAVERYEEFYSIHKDLEETLRPIFNRLSSLKADNGLHG